MPSLVVLVRLLFRLCSARKLCFRALSSHKLSAWFTNHGERQQLRMFCS